MSRTLVDSNVLIDLLQSDAHWYAWSSDAVRRTAERSILVVNPIIYAEISVSFERREELDAFLDQALIEREDLPWEGGFLAGLCYLAYRRQGGERRSPLPDFYIGAHAAVRRYRLLTRDARRYRTYFPTVELIAPPEA